jgi:hypothetical protein
MALPSSIFAPTCPYLLIGKRALKLSRLIKP